jgi:hypothetical protein
MDKCVFVGRGVRDAGLISRKPRNGLAKDKKEAAPAPKRGGGWSNQDAETPGFESQL